MPTYDPHKNTTEVRQGSPRTMNARVLIISLAIVVIGFVVVFLIMQAGQGA